MVIFPSNLCSYVPPWIHAHVFLLVFHQLLPLTFFRSTNICSWRCNTLQHAATHRFIRIENSFDVGLIQENLCLLATKTNLSEAKAFSNGAIPKLNFLVSGRIFVVMSTFSVFWLSYGRSGNEFCAEEGQNPIFDPLPRNEKLCGNLYRKFALRNGLPIS